eukprot:Gregarina_sp_Poly_1__4027@NODE_2219_length_2472_cov_268_755094_g1430_i0_p2_GENE_NODE_2219_length_2472_cov_268_755094_g1430_i0NODE_2219_length_2472_cov_268_755094_g1430_i0_p2_ORF_typecomplete_len251_score36_72_NODE_2219_length_2472_cov_268_755094_g1430_i06131365
MQNVTNVWTSIHTFPATDGSRTLRVSVAQEIIDGLHSADIVGFRHTCFRSPDKRIMSKSEVQDYGSTNWVNAKLWLETFRKRADFQRYRTPKNLPTVVFEELKRGNVKAVNQTIYVDPKSVEGIKTMTKIETSEGEHVALDDWLKREACQVEMCFPLSKDEAQAFLDQAVIMGVRHSFIVDPLTGKYKHSVEVSHTGENWDLLPPWTTASSESIAEPHFRITFQNKLNFNRSRIVLYSQTPWQSEKDVSS